MSETAAKDRPVTDEELREIVGRVVRRTLGEARTGHVSQAPGVSAAEASAAARLVALGADHGGYPLKESLKEFVASLGYAVVDCGTNSAEAGHAHRIAGCFINSSRPALYTGSHRLLNTVVPARRRALWRSVPTASARV